MTDPLAELDATQRQVSVRPIDGEETISVVLRRTLPAAVPEVWAALSDSDRLARWFYPISGDLRQNGSFQLEGNAGGEILRCAAPDLLRVTFGGPISIVELRLAACGTGATALELEHTVPLAMAGSGAGAFYVGPGWDGALMGLARHLAGVVVDDPIALGSSPEIQTFNRGSIDAWTAAIGASGTATADEITAGREAALAQFAPGA